MNLLLGNGINRAYGAISWDDLLKRIANDLDMCKPQNEIMNSLSAYEYIVNKAFIGQQDTSNIIGSIKEVFDKDYKINDDGYAFLKKLLQIPFDKIFTTNFTYEIERTLDENWNSGMGIKNKNETSASNIRHYDIENRKIFHVHGELDFEKSICLGTVKYGENLAKMMKKIMSESSSDNYSDLNEEIFAETTLFSWGQYLFTDDLWIVGFGLGELEIDIWWLIAYRAYMKRQNKICNSIHFYDVVSEADPRKKEMFEVLGIIYEEIQLVDDNWRECYEKIYQKIKYQINN